MHTASYWVEKLGLLRHPEGGYFAETYRAPASIPAGALEGLFPGERRFSTAIYYLLEQGDFSAFHRIRSDELWHFYNGDPLDIFCFNEQGELLQITLGNDPEKGEVLQAVVPAGCWFGSLPASGSRFSLVGCTVAPGFDFEDFEMAVREELLAAYPRFHDVIRKLTR